MNPTIRTAPSRPSPQSTPWPSCVSDRYLHFTRKLELPCAKRGAGMILDKKWPRYSCTPTPTPGSRDSTGSPRTRRHRTCTHRCSPQSHQSSNTHLIPSDDGIQFKIPKNRRPGLAIAELTAPPPSRQNGHSEGFGPRRGHALHGSKRFRDFSALRSPILDGDPFCTCKVSTVGPATRRANWKCIFPYIITNKI